jgi:hypothetical protein
MLRRSTSIAGLAKKEGFLTYLRQSRALPFQGFVSE